MRWSLAVAGSIICIVVVQSLSCVQLFVTPWTAAYQAFLSFTISQTLLKVMSIELVMPSNHLILCCPLLLLPSIFYSIRVFSTGGQSIGASASVLPMNIQGCLRRGLMPRVGPQPPPSLWHTAVSQRMRHKSC